MPFIYLAMTYVKSHKNCKGKKIIFKWNKFEIVKKILEEKCKHLEVKIKIWKLKLGHCKILRILGLSLEFWKVEKSPMRTWHVAVPTHSIFFFLSFFYLLPPSLPHSLTRRALPSRNPTSRDGRSSSARTETPDPSSPTAQTPMLGLVVAREEGRFSSIVKQPSPVIFNGKWEWFHYRH